MSGDWTCQASKRQGRAAQVSSTSAVVANRNLAGAAGPPPTPAGTAAAPAFRRARRRGRRGTTLSSQWASYCVQRLAPPAHNPARPGPARPAPPGSGAGGGESNPASPSGSSGVAQKGLPRRSSPCVQGSPSVERTVPSTLARVPGGQLTRPVPRTQASECGYCQWL